MLICGRSPHIRWKIIEERIESTFMNENLDSQELKSFNVLRIVFRCIGDTSCFLGYKRCEQENK
jgi:hypothetical protein